jgi:hypothetical protein
MADITSFDPQKAPAAIKDLIDLTDDLKKSATETHAFLEERFGCWGDDETGKQFGDQYVPGYHQFWNQSKELYDGLGSSADDLRKIQDSFTEVDRRNADNIR